MKAVLATAILVSGACLAQAPEDEEYKISAFVDQVILPVTVIDRNGEFVGELSPAEFRVYDNGQLRKISSFSHADQPVTAGIVMDHSGSMRAKSGETVLAALRLANLSNPDDQWFVVGFNENVSLGLPAGMPFTNNAGDLRQALLAKPYVGKTALYDALAAAMQHLAGGQREKKALVLVSDGGDNASRHSFQDVFHMAERSSALIYTIGLFDETDADWNPGALKRIARETGGECFLPRKMAELPGICTHIARELRTQYMIAYTPPPGGGYHKITVTASRPGRGGKLTVRTRAGYLARETVSK